MRRSVVILSAALFSSGAFAGALGISTNIGAGATGASQLAIGNTFNNSLGAGMPGGLTASTSAMSSASGGIGAGSSSDFAAKGAIHGTATAPDVATQSANAKADGGVRMENSLIDAQTRTHEQSLRNLEKANAKLAARSASHASHGSETSTWAREQVDVKSQAATHASEQAKESANEHARPLFTTSGQAGATATTRDSGGADSVKVSTQTRTSAKGHTTVHAAD